MQTRTGNDLHFELKGIVYASGSTISINDIGEDNNALTCHTNRPDCCSNFFSRYGEFYYPNGSQVGIKSANGPMYRNRGPQMIRLNRNSNSLRFPPTGLYRCEIPNSNGQLQSISILIEGVSNKYTVVQDMLY